MQRRRDLLLIYEQAKLLLGNGPANCSEFLNYARLSFGRRPAHALNLAPPGPSALQASGGGNHPGRKVTTVSGDATNAE